MKQAKFLWLIVVLAILSVTVLQSENGAQETRLSSLISPYPEEDNGPTATPQENPPPLATPSPPAINAMDAYLSSLPAKTDFKVQRDRSGKPILISGGQFQIPMDQEEAFVQKLAEFLNVPGEQLQKSSKKTTDTIWSKTSQYDQSLESYPVEQAYIRIFRKISDNSIYYVMLEAKPLPELDLRINISSDEAQTIASNMFQMKTDLKSSKILETPVIVPFPQPQLAWKILIRYSEPTYDEREIHISASSGQVLSNFSILQK